MVMPENEISEPKMAVSKAQGTVCDDQLPGVFQQLSPAAPVQRQSPEKDAVVLSDVTVNSCPQIEQCDIAWKDAE